MLYRCLIVGEGFPVVEDGQTSMLGFAATRWVEADTGDEAELSAIEMLREELKADFPIEARDYRSRVSFEEVTVVDPSTIPGILPGLAWYPITKL